MEGLNWVPSLRETPGHQGAWEGAWEFQAGGAWPRCGEAPCLPEDMCLLLLRGVLAGGNKALLPWPPGAGGAAGVWV